MTQEPIVDAGVAREEPMNSRNDTTTLRPATAPAAVATIPLLVLAAGLVLPAPAAAQEATWTAPRTADGQPDLQGIWSNNTATPLERPEAFAGKDALTEEELAELRARAAELRENEQAGNLLGDLLVQQLVDDPNFQEFDPDTGNYNSFWLVERELDARTSLIVDPPDGRLPPMTEAALARFAEAATAPGHPAGPESLPLTERCITFGAPNLLAGYNSYFQILQTPDHVVVLQELIHDARVIPLDARPPVDEAIRQWHGDSRGRWEGDSLVVETANYSHTANLYGASRHSRVTERFTRVDPDTIEYVVTYDDPETWVQPWTVMIPLKRSAASDAVYEYACHEGNYSMEGILAGARKLEAEGR